MQIASSSAVTREETPLRCALDSGRRVCAVLLELLMPEMDGFVFAEELHKHAAWRSIPIVVMTNKDITTDDRQRLHGFVETVLRKSEYSRDERLTKVRGLVARIGRHETAWDTVPVNSP
jgi:CheY-like chemotaxis protein